MTLMTPRAERIQVAVDVEIETVLERRHGVITDLTEGGAQISGEPFAAGEKIKMTVANDTVWARTRWAESDRMGVQFETPIPEALRNLLNARRPSNDQAQLAGKFGRKIA